MTILTLHSGLVTEIEALADSEIQQKIAELSIELAPTSLAQSDEVLKHAARYWLDASMQPDFVRP